VTPTINGRCQPNGSSEFCLEKWRPWSFFCRIPHAGTVHVLARAFRSTIAFPLVHIVARQLHFRRILYIISDLPLTLVDYAA
jgi:hypothetical protein